MNYEEALDWIRQTKSSGMRMGLDRIRELLDRMGNPQKNLKFIHVTGTNGKGSICIMTASILQAAGYKVGMFTSPEIFGFETQFLVNGKSISREDVIACAMEMQPAVEAMEDKPSEFEIITAMAFLYFFRSSCEYVVLEVGMGGRDDATNVIDAPEIAVIANIGLDHTQFLGNTLEEIAAVKAGIIKPGCKVVLADQDPAVMHLIGEVCEKKGCPLYVSDNRQISVRSRSFNGQIFDYRDGERLSLKLLGDHQLQNAAIVIEITHLLAKSEGRIQKPDVRSGLAAARWPGRFEVLREQPMIIIDGAHNPHGVEALVKNLDAYLPGEQVIFITGILADKDYRSMLSATLPYAAEYITIEPANERALSAEACAATIRELGYGQIPVSAAGTPAEACAMALADSARNKKKIIAFGSLYNVKAIRDAVLEREQK